MLIEGATLVRYPDFWDSGSFNFRAAALCERRGAQGSQIIDVLKGKGWGIKSVYFKFLLHQLCQVPGTRFHSNQSSNLFEF